MTQSIAPNPLLDAIRLLTQNAQSLRESVSIAGQPQWAGNEKDKAVYDEHMATAVALAVLVAGERAAPAHAQPKATPADEPEAPRHG